MNASNFDATISEAFDRGGDEQSAIEPALEYLCYLSQLKRSFLRESLDSESDCFGLVRDRISKRGIIKRRLASPEVNCAPALTLDTH